MPACVLCLPVPCCVQLEAHASHRRVKSGAGDCGCQLLTHILLLQAPRPPPLWLEPSWRHVAGMPIADPRGNTALERPRSLSSSRLYAAGRGGGGSPCFLELLRVLTA